MSRRTLWMLAVVRNGTLRRLHKKYGLKYAY